MDPSDGLNVTGRNGKDYRSGQTMYLRKEDLKQ